MGRPTSCWLLFAVVLAGCGLVPNDPDPAAQPGLVSDCQPPLAFEGETTIAELGLVDALPASRAVEFTRSG